MTTIKATMKQKGLTMETDVQEFALALKTWRLRAGLTQAQVGQRFGLSRYTILAIEKGHKVSWETAYKAFAKLSQELTKEGQA